MVISVKSGTALGIVAMLFWASSIAVGRSLTNAMGAYNQGAVAYIGGGSLLLLFAASSQNGRHELRSLSKKYLWVCGFFFAVCVASFYGAIQLAPTDAEIVTVGVINYLWTALVIVFAVPILKKKWRWPLVPGVITALVGVAAAEVAVGGVSVPELVKGLGSGWSSYACALLGAVSWGLYSNFSRKLGASQGIGGVPVFMPLTGCILLVFALAFPHELTFSTKSSIELLYATICPSVLGYLFWDIGMRCGNFVLLGVLSYFIPLLSTVISVVYLNLKPSNVIWVACAFVIIGAAVCKKSIVEESGGGECDA